ncbi:hypothetical protein [Leptolyngbya sp. KIOST-1]|uniref:hypothetical protein n=1 Tax=Leptolyngbya sp. KIOST-1 TaxID=1229172 RepID=UPI000B0A432A|nr:hypothetical protein [Leptolyngbya sp. KIOST-1]
MTLSACATCKNAADGICLLGQSYIDVYQAVQTIADESDREKIALLLACCSFWEESELSKLISCEVTLSQHAWSRIAYIKLQEADQEMFAGLVNVARDVVHNYGMYPGQSIAGEPPAAAVEPSPAEPPALEHSPAAVESVVTAEPPTAAPEPVVTAAEDSPADLAAPPVEEQPEAEVIPEPVSADDGSDSEAEPPAAAENVDDGSDSEAELPAAAESADDLAEAAPVVHQPAQDPVEQAMQELWTLAIASSKPSPSAEAPSLQWGRGSGRITAEAEGAAHLAPAPHQGFQRESLPGIA